MTGEAIFLFGSIVLIMSLWSALVWGIWHTVGLV
jgi:hypothetical protein